MINANGRATTIFCIAVVVIGFMCLGPTQARGGEITSFRMKAGPGLGDVTVVHILTPSPNNDNTLDRSPNEVDIIKVFAKTDIIDTVFNVRNTGGITEYFFSEAGDYFVLNATPDIWVDYHFQLGFGIGAGFLPSSGIDGIDFDEPYADVVGVGGTGPDPTPTSSVFTIRIQPARPDVIDWFAPGTVSPGHRVEFTLSIDLPDVNTGIPAAFWFSSTENGPIDSYQFTLRELPSPLPEPSTLSVVSVGALTCLVVRWRGRKKVS
jgi:hypothetical protein